jgi:hypothetical protein
MSNVTLDKALRTTIGYSNDRIVPHGFRAMFSTIAHEKSNFSSEERAYEMVGEWLDETRYN